MSLDIVYQMDLFNNLFKPAVKKAEDAVTAAKAKKTAIAEKYASDQSAVDKEISEAEAKVNQVAPVMSNNVAPLFSAPAKATGGKSNKKKFSKKRKGGKRTKSQKKRR
jgi:hypothetical protein